MRFLKIPFISILILIHPVVYSQITVKEGGDAMYIFLGENALVANGEIQEIKIFRALDKEKEFRAIGSITPAASLADFKLKAGAKVVREIQESNNLKSEAEVFEYLKKNPEINKYGLLPLSPDFLQAMGVLFIDKEAKKTPKNTVIKYKAEFISHRKEIKETSIICGIAPKIEKPVYKSLIENDSVVSVSWSLKKSGSPEAFWGEVWVSEKANAPFTKAGVTLANESEDGQHLTLSWQHPTTPQLAYSFYLIPQTFVNLSGTASDTISAISSSFNNLSFVNNSSAKDTLGGIYLKWDLLTSTDLLNGIILERTRDTTGNYTVLDTLPATATHYIDYRILPNTHYQYRFKTIDIRNKVSGAAATVTGVYTPKGIILEAPENVKINYDKGGYPRITWTPVAAPEIGGYQVFRASDIDRDFSLISNLIQDSVFVDTSLKTSRINYKYAVKTINYENRTSEFSNTVFGNYQKKDLPKTPYDVESYAEPGKVTLRWKDMTSFDEDVLGYFVYRKPAKETDKSRENELGPSELKALGFEKLYNQPLAETLIADNTVTAGQQYLYAVTSVDIYGTEGNSLGTYHITVPTLSLRAPEIFVRNTSKGIEVTWSDALIDGVSTYLIFRRLANQTTSKQIGSVPRGTEKFADPDVQPSQVYFYSIKIGGTGKGTSPLGLEKSVRKQ